MYDYIALIRCNPSPDDVIRLSVALDAALQAHESSLVFFHGDAAGTLPRAIATTARRGTDWQVCRTSWVRRWDAVEPESPITVATLATLFQHMAGARRVDSFGLGGWFCARPARLAEYKRASPPLLLEIGYAPADDRQRRETLEVALGAAALELDARVLFQGEGLGQLHGGAARGWNQLTDFGLLDVFAEGGAHRPGSGAEFQAVDAVGAVHLRASAATILIL